MQTLSKTFKMHLAYINMFKKTSIIFDVRVMRFRQIYTRMYLQCHQLISDIVTSNSALTLAKQAIIDKLMTLLGTES